MLRIPLLLASNPKAIKGGPVVQLSAGRWRKITVGIVDTIVALVVPSSATNIAIDDNVTGPCNIQAVVITPGKETGISVYMELIEDA